VPSDGVRPCLRAMLAGALLAVIAGGWIAGPAYPAPTKLRAVAQTGPPAAQPPAPPGVPASPQTIAELQRVLTDAVARVEARDAAGVLAHVSEQYKTSPLTKRLVRDQLAAMFALYDAVHARIRIDDVRMVGEHAWVWSTGEVEGRLAMVRRWMPVLSWDKELEVARRENGRWRLYGYQQ
jgi:hypothetical protein